MSKRNRIAGLARRPGSCVTVAVSEPGVIVTATEPRLSAVDLACARGGRVLFADLQFELRPGQLVWLRGANGRGKTTLLRVAAGLAAPAAGRVARALPPVYLGHADALKHDLTATEALQFLLRLHGRAAEPAVVQAALLRLGVAGMRDAPVRTLSQGQRRRVALARLVLEQAPAPWLLDEPYEALDADGVRRVDSLLREHLQRGGCVLMTSHLPVRLQHPAPVEVDLDLFAAA